MSSGLSDHDIIAGGTRLFQEFYNIPDEDLEEALKKYQGFDNEGESEDQTLHESSLSGCIR